VSAAFGGFPAVGRATAIPNAFFAHVLPRLEAPGDVLAFLFAARHIQEQRGDARWVRAADIWVSEGAQAAFAAFGGGREGLEAGLRRCAAAGALIAVQTDGPAGAGPVYFLNDPGSRRAAARARAGALDLGEGLRALPDEPSARPGIFQLYEENIGTITPLLGERLIEAAETYPWEWIRDAFREAAELNRRNWRYIERILQTWWEEGRGDETPGRDPVEARRERYLGGPLGRGASGR
jgi:DnaD/phage-associated family protein